MIKRDTIENSKSCLNKAYDQEQLFIMLARDPAAPVAIRAWIAERLRLGKNNPGDEQIREAYECATLMELQRGEITSARNQQQMPWADADESPSRFLISRFASVSALEARHEAVSWQALTTLFSKPLEAPCTRQSCPGSSCPHKRGPCWSPATFAKATNPRAAAALSLLVFDVDRLPLDQIDEVRSRLACLQYLMHSTHQDRPDSRNLRIVIALSRSISADIWGTFFHKAQIRFAPGTDTSCADASRRYFLPSCPRDTSYFIQVNDGLPLDVDNLLANHSPANPAGNY